MIPITFSRFFRLSVNVVFLNLFYKYNFGKFTTKFAELEPQMLESIA